MWIEGKIGQSREWVVSRQACLWPHVDRYVWLKVRIEVMRKDLGGGG